MEKETVLSRLLIVVITLLIIGVWVGFFAMTFAVLFGYPDVFNAAYKCFMGSVVIAFFVDTARALWGSEFTITIIIFPWMPPDGGILPFRPKSLLTYLSLRSIVHLEM